MRSYEYGYKSQCNDYSSTQIALDLGRINPQICELLRFWKDNPVAMGCSRATKTILAVLFLDCLLCWVFTSDDFFFGLLDPIFFMIGILAIGLLAFERLEIRRK